ncbi:hypothetical protein BN946_scf185011.g17 [Trametes cinnabarina]|uniref:Carboxypeptidase n=1 Tax=Pycnoporus cinnabarinus TaxID=5643 RepID=A0A060SV82_PYCCI|nr:hypothetical protein BN946_scf185011.g17 [Trametes cinnabarina]
MLRGLTHLLLPLVGTAAFLNCFTSVDAKLMSRAELRTKQAETVARLKGSLPRADRPNTSSGVKNITFTNPRASDSARLTRELTSHISYYLSFINGGWVYPLCQPSPRFSPVAAPKLFFWFFPPGPQGSVDDLIFWTNGGPGCSSLKGVLQENGPFQWSYGQARPTQNEYSWTNLSSILFLEHPVGTGFSQGKPNITNEDQLAEQVVGFMQQFLEVFRELQGKKLYLSGESYAGMYVPYIANYIYEHPDALKLSLTGFWISDPTLGYDVVQWEIPIVGFVHKYEHVFSFKYVTLQPSGLWDSDDKQVLYLGSQSFMAHLDAVAARCGYADYFDKHWPVLWDVLGFPGSFFEAQSPIYFDREEVKRVIHAPLNVTWAACSDIDVFVGGVDQSLPPAYTVLPNVIERSERAVIVHGLADFFYIADGARIVIQNMTWNGLQGFQKPIKEDSFIVDGMGALGNVHSERGLTYYEVALSGHEVPQFSPKAAFQIMEYLMGFREKS